MAVSTGIHARNYSVSIEQLRYPMEAACASRASRMAPTANTLEPAELIRDNNQHSLQFRIPSLPISETHTLIGPARRGQRHDLARQSRSGRERKAEHFDGG
jgi:hypothetical protein